MPNPYIGNDNAARFIDYYASSRMLQDTVHRLYDLGVRRREESQRRAEETVYPSHPKTYRTQKEIDEYVNEMVYTEVFRRQKRLAELEWNIYQPTPTHYLSKEDFNAHVQHMYDQEIRRRMNRKQKRLQSLGITQVSKEGSHRGMLQEQDDNIQRRKWRPPSAHLKYDDGKQLLISELAVIHEERRSSPSSLIHDQKVQHRHFNPERLQNLSRPLRVTPKVCKEEDSPIPPFRVF